MRYNKYNYSEINLGGYTWLKKYQEENLLKKDLLV